MRDDQASELTRLFEEIGCRVVRLDDETIEVVASEYEVVTRVSQNPAFLQFSTMYFLRPRSSAHTGIERRDRFLNFANQVTQVSKFHCDECEIDPKWGCWLAAGMSRWVRSDVGAVFTKGALEAYFNLWLLDLAKVTVESENDSDFEVLAYMKGDESDSIEPDSAD